ncbi:MAG TPA: SH3 domain-containing protein [Rudaea sp.]|jgi:uncharacterized protein YraI|nr:SH3 domain-containing protein [Rudaea sp.]
MKRLLGTAIALALAAPMFAYAAEGFLVADISLQSGPDSEYPAITDLAAGTPVDVQGCIEGYSWCDVVVGDDRGWVPGTYLEEEYDNQPVFLADYGPRIGIPVVTFSIGSYWDAHYHNRPFYGQRTQWVNRHFTQRQPPRPSIAHAPPIPNRGGGRPGEGSHAPQQGHAPPQRTTANTPQPPRPTANTEHRAAVTNNGEHSKVDTAHTNTTHTETVRRTTTNERATNATPQSPANRATPKAKEASKAPPKDEKKQPERKDDDHGH